MSPTEVRREHVSSLSLKIADVLNHEKITDAFLALLVNVDFVIEELLNHNPPDDAEPLRNLHDLVIIAHETGFQTLLRD